MCSPCAGLERLPSLMIGGTCSKGSSKLGNTVLLKSGGGTEEIERTSHETLVSE